MATAAKPGIGAILNRWDTSGSSGVWQEIAEVTNLSWSGASRNTIEVFRLNNTTEYTNKLQGTLNGGEISATVLFTYAGFQQLKTDLETRGNINYQIVLPDGEGLEWSGFVQELPLDIGADDVMQSEVVFAVDEDVAFLQTATP